MNRHQALLLSMLKDIDALCGAYHISYQLFAGTALGAVRHGGFIPWDDDLDLVMPRADYNRFLELASRELDPERYYMQAEFGPHWPMQFSKLRRCGTACMEKYHPRDEEMHQGVYVDIFPCDNLSRHRPIRLLQYLGSRAVVAQCLDRRGYETHSLLKKAFMLLCRPLPTQALHRFCLRAGEPDSPWVHTFFGCGSKYRKNVFPRTWFAESVRLPFEDGCFPVSAQYDALLTRLYGDYHRLPTREERAQKEHAAILDLDRPYQDYLEQHRSMRFANLTRSIR